MFLHWAKGEEIIEEEEETDDGEAEPKRKRQHKEDNIEVKGCHGYKVVKTPGYGNVTVDMLINKFHAADKHFILSWPVLYGNQVVDLQGE